MKTCTFSLRSSNPVNEEARKAWLGTTTSNVSLSLWAGSAFLIALIKFLTIQRYHTSLPVVPPLARPIPPWPRPSKLFSCTRDPEVEEGRPARRGAAWYMVADRRPCISHAWYMVLVVHAWYAKSRAACHAYTVHAYLREKGPMGGAPYIGSRLGDGPIFEVSLSQLDAKERPGKLSTQSS